MKQDMFMTEPHEEGYSCTLHSFIKPREIWAITIYANVMGHNGSAVEQIIKTFYYFVETNLGKNALEACSVATANVMCRIGLKYLQELMRKQIQN